MFDRVRRSLRARARTYRLTSRAAKKERFQQGMEPGTHAYRLFIFGCQRSGTTLLERMFRHDLNSAVFGEFSALTIDPQHKTVLRDLDEVGLIMDRTIGEYTVARTLFESDRAVEILDHFPNSSAVWMFRDCHAVVNSMKNKWGARFFETSRRVEADRNGDWRLEGLYRDILSEVGAARESMQVIEDCYALYWLSRARMIFDRGLYRDDRILFLDYRRLVTHPHECLQRVIRKAGGGGLWPDFSTDAGTFALKRRLDIHLSERIEERCQEMQKRLSALGERDFGSIVNGHYDDCGT